MSTPSSAKPSGTDESSAQPSAAATATAPPAAAKTMTRRPAAGARMKAYAIPIAAIALLIAVVMGVPRNGGRPDDDPAVAVPPTEPQARVAEPVSTVPPPEIVSPPARVSTAASTTVSAKKNRSAVGRVAAASSTAATPVADMPARDEAVAKPADVEPATTAPAAASSAAETSGFDSATITGCLEISANEDRFRLTDTDGVPKARSWRTGFLKKRSAAVDLVDAPDSLALDKQVGKRVAATGVLMNRTLKVASVRVVSPTCN